MIAFSNVGSQLPRYLEMASRALDRAEIPPSLRAFIRAYFDRLAAG